MKFKLLATLASVLLAGSMLAQNLNTESIEGSMLGGANPSQNINILSMQKVAELDGSPIKTLATGEVFTIEGQYNLTLFDYGTKTTSSVTATITRSGNNYSLNDPNSFLSNIPFTFRNNTLTFTPQYFGTVNIGVTAYARVEPFKGGDRNSTTTFTRQTSMSVPFDASTGTIQFENPSGFCWVAYSSNTNFNNNTLYGIVGAKEFISCEPWKDAGTAIFVDGWVLPAFGKDVTDVKNWYEVPLQQATNNSKRYRLVDPYHCNPNFETGDNTSTTKGYINFNISDANHVVFETGVDAGWANPEAEVTTFYCYNQLGWYMDYYNVPASTVIEQLGDLIPYTTYKNGVVSLDYIIDNREKIYDATFGYQDDPLAGYYWPGDLSARIIMPGGKAVGIANSTVEATAVSDKTATISFDFKTFNLAASDKVYVTVTNGRLYTQTIEIDGTTHADVTIDGLFPTTTYNMTITLDVKSGNSTVATSFPTTVTFTTLDEIVVPETWNDAGTAVFMDGWVSPEFGYDQKDVKYWYEVPLQQNSINKNRYRLVDPYHCNPYFKPGENTSTTTGYINFDISDEDHVIVETGVEAGWANPSEGITKIYCFNSLAYRMAYDNKDAQTVIKEHGSDIPYATYKNGVIDLGSMNMPELGLTYDAIFGYNNEPLYGGAWGDEYGNVYDMTARIIMPGGIAVGIANSTVAANNETDKTATISFDFKTFNAPSNSTVYATLSDGQGYSKRVQISGTHADVELTELQPLTSYNMTLTLEVIDRFNTSVATSFPATVSFTTTEEIIVVPEKEVEKYTLTLAVGQTVNPAAYLLNAEPTAWASDDDAVADIDGTDIVGRAFGNTVVTGTDADGDAVAQIDVNVCPVLTVAYPEGVTLAYNVIYGSRADVAISPLGGWKVNSLALDGIDVTADFADGRYLSAEPLSADATLVVVTEAQGNTTTYKVFVDGSSVQVDNADITAVTVRYIQSNIEAYSGTLDALSLEPGAYTIELTDASGVVSSFRVVLQ